MFSLNYLPCAGRLTIDVIKAKQLLQTDLYGGSGTYIYRYNSIYFRNEFQFSEVYQSVNYNGSRAKFT